MRAGGARIRGASNGGAVARSSAAAAYTAEANANGSSSPHGRVMANAEQPMALQISQVSDCGAGSAGAPTAWVSVAPEAHGVCARSPANRASVMAAACCMAADHGNSVAYIVTPKSARYAAK